MEIYLFEELEKILNKNIDRYYSKAKSVEFKNYVPKRMCEVLAKNSGLVCLN
jgi:hypothetical protein